MAVISDDRDYLLDRDFFLFRMFVNATKETGRKKVQK
jgi:hypothetical protein